VSSGKYIHLGYFVSEVDAAQAYDTKAKEVFGDFARINFPSRVAGEQAAATSPVFKEAA